MSTGDIIRAIVLFITILTFCVCIPIIIYGIIKQDRNTIEASILILITIIIFFLFLDYYDPHN